MNLKKFEEINLYFYIFISFYNQFILINIIKNNFNLLNI